MSMKNIALTLTVALSAVLISACSKTDKLLEAGQNVEDMKTQMKTLSQKMDDTNVKMEKMVSAVHDQQILIPYKELLDPKNGEVLSPIPFHMMAFGKKMAEAARSDELTEVVYLHLKEIDESYPTKQQDQNGNDVPFDKETITRINNEKTARYMALSVAVGHASPELISQIILDQIVNSGRYEETAYQILMMRFNFIRDVLLDSSLLSKKLSTVGEVTESIVVMQKLDFIAKLPFASKIALKTTGFLAPGENIDESLKPKSVLAKWESIRQKAELDCKIENQAITGDSVKDAFYYKERGSKYTDAIATIDSYIKTWK